MLGLLGRLLGRWTGPVVPPERRLAPPEPELGISPARLDEALQRLREEIPAPSEDTPQGPSA